MAYYRAISRLFRLGGMLAAGLVIAACGGGGSGGDISPPPPPPLTADITAPSTPSNVVITATSSTSARVIWTPSVDPTVAGATTSGMSGYQVLRCQGAGCAPITVFANPSVPEVMLDGLSPGTTYRVAVLATDFASNRSETSTLAEVTLPTVPPPPPPGDTTPPQVATVSPVNGQLGVDPAIGQVVVEMSEQVQCPSAVPNAVTLTGGGMQVSATLTCGADAQSNTLFLGLGSQRLLYRTLYTVTIAGGVVKDLAGNAMAAASVSQFTTTASPMAAAARVYTANYGATPANGRQYISSVDPSNGYAVEHVTLGLVSTQWAIASDAAAGKVYSAGIATSRGIDVIDVATGATSSISFDPDPAQFEYVEALAVRPEGVYAAYSNNMGYPGQPTLRNRIFRFDRLTQVELNRSGALTADSMTPVGLVAHPDPLTKRIYVLSATKSAMNVIDVNCGIRDYQPGTVGTVTELNAETLATLRTFSVGSVPMSGVIHQATNKLYVGNAGDRTISTVDLATGAVTTASRLATFTGCRQPGGMALDLTGARLWVSDSNDGVHAFNLAMVETAFVSTGNKSFPYGLTFADGKLYAALWGPGYNSVSEIAGVSLARTVSVGPNPVALTTFVPN
ncbi:MAG: Ig-like domain-containing protein [Candidatus Moraniibacteriota bacterium]